MIETDDGNMEVRKGISARLGLCLVYAIAPLLTLGVGIHRPGITGWKPALYEDLIYGRASAPFVKRQLIPVIVRGLTQVTPTPLQETFEDWFSRSEKLRKLEWNSSYATEYIWGLLLMYGCLLGSLVLLHRFLCMFLAISRGQAHLAIVAMAALLPASLSGKMYYYDWGGLLLFTGCLLLMYQRRWIWFYPIYLLASLNKETAIMLPMVLCVWLGRACWRRQNLMHILSQVVICGSIALALAWVYRNNAAWDTSWCFERNLALRHLKCMPEYRFGWLAYMRLTIMAIGITLAMWKIRSAQSFVRRGYILMLVVLLGTMLFLGFLDELRDMYEILGFTMVLILGTLGGRWGIRFKNEREERNPA